MSIIEQETIHATDQAQRESELLDVQPLIYGEAIVGLEGQHFLVDDLSRTDLSYTDLLNQIAKEHPNIIPLTNKELNGQLAYMLRKTVGSIPTNPRTGEHNPRAVKYICPGGGGKRMVRSLNEQGYETLNVKWIDTQRDPVNRAKAIVSAESAEELKTLTESDAKVVVIFDDAVNGGGTIEAIINELKQNNQLDNSIIMVGTQIRFIGSEEYASGYVKGVKGYKTAAGIVKGVPVVAAKVIVSPYSDRSAPLTYASSHTKREITEDRRLEGIAGEDTQQLTRLQEQLEQAKHQYMQDQLGIIEDQRREEQEKREAEQQAILQEIQNHLPPHALLNILVDVLTEIDDIDLVN